MRTASKTRDRVREDRIIYERISPLPKEPVMAIFLLAEIMNSWRFCDFVNELPVIV